MSRQPIGKGERITFILNPANPNERLILDYFKNSFNRSADIKQILYNYCIGNQLSNDDNKVVINYPMNDNSMINDCTISNKSIVNDCEKNDNKSFDINLEEVEDEEVNISNPTKANDATKAAMNFMLNM